MGVVGTVWLPGLVYVATQFVNHGAGAVFQDDGSTSGPAARASQNTCAHCHRLPERLTHPVGIVVARDVALPLGEGRTLVCATCHDPGQHKSAGIRGAALRLPAPDLCRECHEPDPAMTRVEHAIAVGRAHFLGSSAKAPVRDVDVLTRECLGCHDGSVAADRHAAKPVGQRGSHPVGRAYDELSRAGRKSHLRPRASLPEDVQLPAGTVGCQTCHSPFSREPDMLTGSMHESRLCRVCHDL